MWTAEASFKTILHVNNRLASGIAKASLKLLPPNRIRHFSQGKRTIRCHCLCGSQYLSFRPDLSGANPRNGYSFSDSSATRGRCFDRCCCHTALFSGTQECHRTNTALRLGRSAAAAALCSVDYPVCQGPGTT